uniref:Nuclear receptor coactivator 5 n=1 Tax=Schistocephalus solidus TaxID=70667 RepID=A0A0X3PQ93_SCHSO
MCLPSTRTIDHTSAGHLVVRCLPMSLRESKAIRDLQVVQSILVTYNGRTPLLSLWQSEWFQRHGQMCSFTQSVLRGQRRKLFATAVQRSFPTSNLKRSLCQTGKLSVNRFFSGCPTTMFVQSHFMVNSRSLNSGLYTPSKDASLHDLAALPGKLAGPCYPPNPSSGEGGSNFSVYGLLWMPMSLCTFHNNLSAHYYPKGAAATTTTAALKSRILDMLYPNQKQGQPQSQDQPAAEHGNAPAQTSVPYAQPNSAAQEQLVSKLQNPSVQQALNSLLQTSQSTGPVSQPSAALTTGPTPLFPRAGTNQVTQPTSSSSWQDWSHNTAAASAAAAAAAATNWPPSSSSTYDRDNTSANYGQRPTRWGEQPYGSAGDENDNGQRYGTPYANLMEIETKPPWLSSRASKRYRKKFSKRQQEFQEPMPPSPPPYGQQNFPRTENPAQSSRFVLPPQVVPGDGAGVGSNQPSYATQSMSSQGDVALGAAATATADPYQSLYSSNQPYPTQHYGGPGAPPGVPSFTLPAEPAQQPKGWPTYGSGYNNY